MNIVNEWEQKAIMFIKRSKTVKSRELRSELECKASTYCDCIQYFTDDRDKWSCFDRLCILVRNEIGDAKND